MILAEVNHDHMTSSSIYKYNEYHVYSVIREKYFLSKQSQNSRSVLEMDLDFWIVFFFFLISSSIIHNIDLDISDPYGCTTCNFMSL